MVEDFVCLVECLLTTLIDRPNWSYVIFVDCSMWPSEKMLEVPIEKSSVLSPALVVTHAGFSVRELDRPERSYLRYTRRPE